MTDGIVVNSQQCSGFTALETQFNRNKNNCEQYAADSKIAAQKITGQRQSMSAKTFVHFSPYPPKTCVKTEKHHHLGFSI